MICSVPFKLVNESRWTLPQRTLFFVVVCINFPIDIFYPQQLQQKQIFIKLHHHMCLRKFNACSRVRVVSYIYIYFQLQIICSDSNEMPFTSIFLVYQMIWWPVFYHLLCSSCCLRVVVVVFCFCRYSLTNTRTTNPHIVFFCVWVSFFFRSLMFPLYACFPFIYCLHWMYAVGINSVRSHVHNAMSMRVKAFSIYPYNKIPFHFCSVRL